MHSKRMPRLLQDVKAAHERDAKSAQAKLDNLRQQLSSVAAEMSFLREEARVAASERSRAVTEAQAAQQQVGWCSGGRCFPHASLSGTMP
jgi:hypothetical protein